MESARATRLSNKQETPVPPSTGRSTTSKSYMIKRLKSIECMVKS